MSHQLALFGGHWSSVSEDINHLIYHVISQNHETDGSSDVLSGSFSWHAITLPSLWGIGIVLVEI